MATILNRQVTFSTNGTVTAAGLHNLIDETEIYAGIITTQPVISSVGSSDQLLIADADLTPTSAPRRVTVGSMFNDALNNGVYTSSSFTGTLTAGSFVGPLNGNVTGTIVGTGGTISSLTTGTTTSTAANITNGTVQTLTASTGTIGTFNSTTGTIATLNSTTGTIATLNSTTGTITNLSATTSTFLGAITASTNIINIGSGQIFKAANGNVTIGTNDAGDALRYLDIQNTNSSANAGAILRLITRNVADSGNTPVDIVKYKTGGFTISNAETNAAAFTSFNVGASERMRIDSSGNVGIGRSPTNKLDILATSNTGITISNGTMTGIFSNSADTSIVFGTQTNHPLNFYANNLLAATLSTSGNFGIGTSSPSGTLHSVSTSSSVTPGIFAITATSSTATPAVAVIKQDALNTTNQSFVLFQVGGGTNCGKINANGANTAAFGSTSDARLKENITALPSQIDNVCALRPCEFDYKDGSGHQIGFIAQEMQEVYPDSVGVGDDGMLTITAWSKTEARLVKAIQELKAKNDLLEARLEALEAK